MRIQQETLKRGLDIVKPYVMRRATLPVLQCILLRGQKDGLGLSATNLEQATRCEVEAWDGEEEWALAVPAGMICDLVETLRSPITIFKVDDTAVCIADEVSTCTLRGFGEDEFPRWPYVRPKMTETFYPELLRTAILQAGHAAAEDETRPVLTAICMDYQEDRFTFVAADGFRLAQAQQVAERPVSRSGRVLVSASWLGEIAKLLGEEGEAVSLEVDQTYAKVKLAGGRAKNEGIGDIVSVSTVLEGDFPNYRDIVPRGGAVKVQVDGNELRRALSTVQVSLSMLEKDAGFVHIDVFEDELRIKAEGLDAGGLSSVSAQVTGLDEAGEDVFFKITPAFLLEALRHVTTGWAEIWINGPYMAISVVDSHSGYVAVIMPRTPDKK